MFRAPVPSGLRARGRNGAFTPATLTVTTLHSYAVLALESATPGKQPPLSISGDLPNLIALLTLMRRALNDSRADSL